MAEDREESRGFTVSDRRRFAETGETRTEPDPSGAADPHHPQNRQQEQPEDSQAHAGEFTSKQSHLPEINLSTFVISLSTQALMHMGEIPNPIDNTVKCDMAAAKQVIDILGMLKEKTKGNLEKNEETLFDNVLYDLRIRYVELTKSAEH